MTSGIRKLAEQSQWANMKQLKIHQCAGLKPNPQSATVAFACTNS